MKKYYISFLVFIMVMFTMGTAMAVVYGSGGSNSSAEQLQMNSITNEGNTFNSDSRGFMNSPIINYPQTPNLFVNLPDGKNIRSLNQLIKIKSLWTREELVALQDGAKLKMVDGNALFTDDAAPEAIRVYFGIPGSTNGMQLKAALFTGCKIKTNSFQSFAIMAIHALDIGANVLCIETEGASHELYSKAAGFMIGGSASHIGSDSATIGTGGIGISCGSAGYRSKPYHHGFAFESTVPAKDLKAATPIQKMRGGQPIAPGKTVPAIK